MIEINLSEALKYLAGLLSSAIIVLLVWLLNFRKNKNTEIGTYIDNWIKIIGVYKEQNEKLEKQVYKLQDEIDRKNKRIGYLEGKLREETFEKK